MKKRLPYIAGFLACLVLLVVSIIIMTGGGGNRSHYIFIGVVGMLYNGTKIVHPDKKD